jgi:NAD+ kinase
VEEGPAKPKKTKRPSVTPDHLKAPAPIDESAEDEEVDISDEEEDEDEEDEEDEFDIDDSSPEAANLKPATVNTNLMRKEERLVQEKVTNVILENALHKAVADSALRQGRRQSKSRSRSRSGLRSGVDSPNRFAHPQAPTFPRHVEFDLGSPSPPDISETETMNQRDGARDDIHSNRAPSRKSRIPKDRDDFENIKTPTASSLVYGRTRGQIRSRSADHHGRRAFAVWGHDESDSNTSDGSS